MSANQTKASQSSPEEQDAQAKAAVGGVLLLATAKYLPIVLMGVMMGTIVNQGARGAYGVKRFRDLAASDPPDALSWRPGA